MRSGAKPWVSLADRWTTLCRSPTLGPVSPGNRLVITPVRQGSVTEIARLPKGIGGEVVRSRNRRGARSVCFAPLFEVIHRYTSATDGAHRHGRQGFPPVAIGVKLIPRSATRCRRKEVAQIHSRPGLQRSGEAHSLRLSLVAVLVTKESVPRAVLAADGLQDQAIRLAPSFFTARLKPRGWPPGDCPRGFLVRLALVPAGS